MKLLTLIEAINKRIKPPLHPKVVAVFMGRAYNQIIYDTFRKDLSNMDLFAKTYLGVEIEHDEDQDLYYSELPVSIVQLPNPGDGVRWISSHKGKEVEFSPIKAEEYPTMRNLEVHTQAGAIPYWLTGNRVEYGEKVGINKIDQVKIRIIPQLEDLEMTDDIYIPSGKDEQFLNLVINFINGSPTDKEINDQTLKTV